MTERKAFEKHCLEANGKVPLTWAGVDPQFELEEDMRDRYFIRADQQAWLAWQASRQQALEEAYDAMFAIKGCRATRFDAQTAIRSLTSPIGDKA